MSLLAAIVGLAGLVGYLYAAGPTFYWLDSSELVAAGFSLGVSHPPGHPLHALISRLFCMLPVGTIAFRVTLASAVEAAAATALTATLCWQVVRRMLDARRPAAAVAYWVAPLSAATAALLLGLSYALWFQAVRAEVYALNLAVLTGGGCLVLHWDRTRDSRLLLVAALVCGLGLGNHNFLVLLGLPPVLVFLLLSWRRSGGRVWRSMAAMLLAGCLGLCVLAYLPLRAARHPLVNWGAPSNAERLGWVVSAKAFQKSVGGASVENLEHRTLRGVFTVVRGIAWDSMLGLAVALAALIGLYLLLRRRGTREVGLLLALMVGFNLLSPVLLGSDPYNPDAYGYLCVSLAFLCPAVAAALVQVFSGLDRLCRGWAPLLAATGCLALVIGQVSRNLPRVDLRSHWAAEETGRQLLEPLPARSLLVTSYFETVFNLWALRIMGDLRPDVDLLHRNFLAYPGYVEELAHRQPDLARDARRWKRARRLILSDLERLAHHRPLFIEHDLNLPRDLTSRLEPAGLVPRLGGVRSTRTHMDRMERWQQVVLPDAWDNETRRNMVWTHYQLARFVCSAHPPHRTAIACDGEYRGLARYHIRRALELASEDRTLAALAHSCGF